MESSSAAAPLSAAAASALHSSIAGMSVAGWLDAASLHSTLARAEGLLCALHGCPGLPAYIQRVTGAGGGGCPCTSVWTAGTIAYRCRTCGLSPSAAICVDCFRESDHEGHDYTMYTSDAGGCCDCGDMSSWRPSGCCRRHRPAGRGTAAAAAPTLPPGDAAIAQGIAACALVRLQLALEACLRRDQPGAAALERAAALRLMSWLGQLAQAPALRDMLCDALLQPSTPSVAAQAGSLAATAGLPADLAAVARMLQQQREALLERLAAVLPVPGEAEAEGLGAAIARQQRPLPLPGRGPHQLSLLYWQLSAMLPLEGHLVEELATLHILLLYSVPFKTHFGRALLCFYPHLGALGKRHAVTKALDRLTVQVFHLEETTLELAERDGLLEVLLGSLLAVLRRGVGAGGRLDGDSPVLAGRQYLRIAADLHMALAHPAVVLHLLGGPQAALFSGAFLQVFRLVQGASPYRRKHGDHVLYESTAWMNVVQLEVHTMHMLKQGALHTLMKAAEEGAVPAEAAASALGFALDAALAAVEEAAGPQQTAEDPHAFWSTVLAGQREVSAHIPLERIAAACLAGLLHLGQASPHPVPYLEAAARALGSAPGLEEGAREAAARRWEMCGVAAGRVLAWMSQIRQRLWVRNGQQLLRLEAFYSSPYWSDHGLDCDLLAVQAWQASAPSTSRALGFFAVDGSGLRLLRASAASSMAEALASLQTSAQSQEMLRCLADWLRLLVVTLKERSVWHPTYSPLQLRRALVHALAVGARSHSELEDELPYELAHSPHFDEVLAQVADYRPPTAAATGRYALKRDCWREFDPFFPHYTRRDLQTALHTAQESGAWQPEWQLAGGLPAVPAPMAGLQRLLHHQLRLVWTALLLACSDAALFEGGAAASGSGGGPAAGAAAGGGAAEDCALAALSLLCLALQCKQAGFAALIGRAEAAAQAAAGGPTPPPLPAAWSTPASFRLKAEEYFVGSPPERPGIQFLLRVLAGQEAWVDGSRREASWELKACAAAAAAQVQQLLQTVRQHTDSPAGVKQHGTGAAEAGAAASPVEPGAGGAQAGDAARQLEQRRKLQAKQRQQQMLARMRAQQARAAAALLDEQGGETPPGQPASAAGSAPALQEQLPAEPEADAMEVDAEQQQAAVQAGAGPAAVPERPGQRALPTHHPAALERCAGAECALCHGGSETAPLGLVAQLQVTELPLLASTDGPAGLAPGRPGVPAGAIGAPSEEEHERGAELEPFPAAGAGPRLSLYDRQPSMHLLCCGHTLHAACLDRYRSSWRQRIASGQFVEGFQLLQASTSAGEYLCPICRRLGNCLLPVAAGLGPTPEQDSAAAALGTPAAAVAAGAAGQTAGAAQQPQRQEEQRPVLGRREALQRLEGLLADEASWVAAPATSNAELVQRWQAAQEEGAAGGGAADALRLLPRLGAHAAGVAALCEFVRLTGTKWILQQQRVLDWLQARGPAAEPLWRVPVTPAPGTPAVPAAAGGAPPHHPSLEEALQDLLEHAAAADGQAAQALEAFVAAAGAMEVELEAQMGESEGEGSEEEDEGEQAALQAAAGMAAVFEQLQQQAAAAADDATAAEEQAGSPAAAAGRGSSSSGTGGGAAATAIQQHNRRLWASRSAGGLLWSLLGSGIVQWECAHRDIWAAPSSEVDAAHWRALQSLALLALAAGMGGQQEALDALHDLAGGRPVGAAPTSEVSAALLPTLLQLEQPPSGTSCRTDQDPFALLLQLLAALLTWPAGVTPGSSPVCTAHSQPAAVLEALLAVLYPAVAGQALGLALGSSASSAAAVAEAVGAMAGSPPLASAAEGAVSVALLPWLQRGALLLALLRGQPAPPPPAARPGSTTSAAAALLQQLHLPPLAAALQQLATGNLPLVAVPPAGVPSPPGVQLSIHAGGRLWEVAAPPPPAAPQLLQLPASFQAWYLSMGSQPCSACGQQPSEPALCLRCGAVVCCGSRRCHGPAQQGMCYTHALACGGGACAYLLLKMTRLLVIRKNRATFLASPYVDSHGEEDLRLQRGKPLSLHADRVRNLLQLWRSAALDFDSHVLHSANQRSESAAIY